MYPIHGDFCVLGTAVDFSKTAESQPDKVFIQCLKAYLMRLAITKQTNEYNNFKCGVFYMTESDE